MSNYILHNGTFVEVSDEELTHKLTWNDFKYIKREWKNGRWHYYYKDDEETKLKAEHKKAQSELKAARKKADVATKRAAEAELEPHKTKYGTFDYDAKPSAEQAETIKRSKEEAAKAVEDYKKASKKASEIQEKYITKQVISFPEKAVYVGQVACGHLLDGIRDATQGKNRRLTFGGLKGAASATTGEDSKRTVRSDTKKPPKPRSTKRRTR